MKFIPPQEMTEEELVHHLPVPAFLPHDFNTSEMDQLKEVIKESNLPDLPKKDEDD